MRLFFFFLFCLCCAYGCKKSPFFKDAGPLVKTNTGYIIGKHVIVFDTEVVAFLGIPFAKPPVGGLRFTKPQPIEPWDGILQADTKPPPCIQYNSRNFTWLPLTMPSENCLFLNIWSPLKRCSGDTNKLPVMVWIHGGSFTGGSTDIPIYDGSVIASHAEVIVVSINYRLGIFGFFNGGTKKVSGNAGLFDQNLAMKWVKDNIEGFGGDPESITLFGESAGSISISLHMVSPLSKDLFNRAILQSGTMYNPHLTDSKEAALLKGNIFAKSVGCANEKFDLVKDPSVVIECLRKKDTLELAKSEKKLADIGTMFFMPSVGNKFLTKSPIESAENGQIAQKDVLIGATKDEGTMFLAVYLPELFSFSESPQIDLSQAEKILAVMFPNISEYINNLYLKKMEVDTTFTDSLAKAFGDSVFCCPIMFFAEKLNKAYMYWLTHRSMKDTKAEWLGSHHFYEVPYVFGVPLIDSLNYTPEDKKHSWDLIHKWTHFARHGHPMPEESKKLWPKFSSGNPVAMELNPRTSGKITFPRRQVCKEFWKSILVQNIT